MIGLAVLAAMAVYIAICWLVFRSLKQKWAKAATVLVALAIPFWDVAIGYSQYRAHCSADGGLKVFAHVPAQNNVYFDSMPLYSANELLSRGFKVVEIARPDGKGIARHQTNGSGLVTAIVAKPESRFKVSLVEPKPLQWNIYRHDRLLTNNSDNQIVARHSEFNWRGGWLQHRLAPLLGPGFRCKSEAPDPITGLLLTGGSAAKPAP